MFALDFATQVQQMKAIGGQPDYALGSVHAITADGTLVMTSACRAGSASWGPAPGRAGRVGGGRSAKLVPTLAAARERIYTDSLPLEDARAHAGYRAAQPGREDPGDPHRTARPYGHVALVGGLSDFEAPGAEWPPGAGRYPVTVNATPADRQLALAPLDENVDHVRGAQAGRLIIEYGDYECP